MLQYFWMKNLSFLCEFCYRMCKINFSLVHHITLMSDILSGVEVGLFDNLVENVVRQQHLEELQRGCIIA